VISAGTLLKAKVEPYHYQLILSDPNANGEVILVTCSDAAKHQAETVHLKAGEHPDITKDTALILSRAHRGSASKIAACIPLHFDQCPSLDQAVLLRLQVESKASGRLKSDYVTDLP